MEYGGIKIFRFSAIAIRFGNMKNFASILLLFFETKQRFLCLGEASLMSDLSFSK